MRNGWDEGGMPSLRGDSSTNKVPDDNGTRRYDFGVSRPISAPPPSGMGFEVSRANLAFIFHPNPVRLHIAHC